MKGKIYPTLVQIVSAGACGVTVSISASLHCSTSRPNRSVGSSRRAWNPPENRSTTADWLLATPHDSSAPRVDYLEISPSSESARARSNTHPHLQLTRQKLSTVRIAWPTEDAARRPTAPLQGPNVTITDYSRLDASQDGRDGWNSETIALQVRVAPRQTSADINRHNVCIFECCLSLTKRSSSHQLYVSSIRFPCFRDPVSHLSLFNSLCLRVRPFQSHPFKSFHLESPA